MTVVVEAVLDLQRAVSLAAGSDLLVRVVALTRYDAVLGLTPGALDGVPDPVLRAAGWVGSTDPDACGVHRLDVGAPDDCSPHEHALALTAELTAARALHAGPPGRLLLLGDDS